MSFVVTVHFAAKPEHREALRAHLATDHYLRFNETTAPWVAEKRVATYHRLDPRT